jgi:anti-sigma B factor antagonist
MGWGTLIRAGSPAGVVFAIAGDGASDAPARPPQVPARAPFAVVTDVGQDATTVIVSGDVDLATAPEVERCLKAYARAARLVIDLSGVRFLDSCGMTVLVHAMRRASESRQNLALRPPADATVMRALEITGLLTALPFEPSPTR